MLKQVLSLTPELPKVLKGLYYTQLSSPKVRKSIGWAIEENGRKNPQNTALLHEDWRINYGDFNNWCNQISHFFLDHGYRKGDEVGLLMSNRPEFFAILGGLSKIGVITAVFNTNQKGRVLEHSIGLTSIKGLICGSELKDSLDSVKGLEDIKRQGQMFEMGETTASQHEPNSFERDLAKADNNNPTLSSPVTIKDPAFYIFTSGTTGLPKASIMTHGRWMKAYGGFGLCALRLTKEDICYLCLPLYHNNALTVTWSSVLASGAAIAIAPKFSKRKFWKDVRRYEATSFAYIGEICRYLFQDPPSALDRQHKVKKMIGNGLRPDIWEPFKERFGIDHVAEFYASSEGNIGFTNVFNHDRTVGFSPAPFEVVAYDQQKQGPKLDKQGRFIPIKRGETGLLITKITKKWPFEGYTEDQQTKAVVLKNELWPKEAFFNTGDLVKKLGFRHIGFVDRTGDTFRWKGENVSTAEVESALHRFPGIDGAAVYGVKLPNTDGQAGMATIAGDLSDENLREFQRHLESSLPSYARPIFVRQKQTLSTTGTYKIQKGDLKSEGYNLDRVDDPIYYFEKSTGSFKKLNPEALQQIQSRRIQF